MRFGGQIQGRPGSVMVRGWSALSPTRFPRVATRGKAAWGQAAPPAMMPVLSSGKRQKKLPPRRVRWRAPAKPLAVSGGDLLAVQPGVSPRGWLRGRGERCVGGGGTFSARARGRCSPTVHPAIQARHPEGAGSCDDLCGKSGRDERSNLEAGPRAPRWSCGHTPSPPPSASRGPHSFTITRPSFSAATRPVCIRQRSTASRRAAATMARLRARAPFAARTTCSGG